MHDYEHASSEGRGCQDLPAHELPGMPSEQTCAELLETVARLLDMPMAMLSRIDEERQWFDARIGLDAVEGPHDDVFCEHAANEHGTLRIPNTLEDPRFAHSRLVMGRPWVRSCYGVALRTSKGHVLGALCVLDRRPRVLGAKGVELLELVARQVGWVLDLGLAGLEAHRAAAAARQAKQVTDSFLVSMSHELRTPLSAIIGFSSILRRNKSGKLESYELDYIDRIRANGEYLLRLVGDILDMSKVEAGFMKVDCSPVDPVDLVQTLLRDLEGREALVPVVFDAPTRVVELVVADHHRLRQVVLNLVSNAMKFTEAGAIELRIIVDGDGKPLRLDVVDSGIGIALEEQAKIFERHGQANSTQARAGSWGLGLFLSRRLCELMGFSLAVASELGKGTTFSVMLDDRAPPPVHRPPRQVFSEETPEPARTSSESRRDKTVLVVDDDADARAILEHYIQDFGCRVIAVDSGERALEIARQVRPDLITLDLMMPGTDGWTVFQTLREDPELAQIPVAICSVAEVDGESSLPGAIVCDKPVDRQRFHSMLDQCLSGSSKQTVLVVEPDSDRGHIIANWVFTAGCSPRVVVSEVDMLHALHEDQPSLVLFGYNPQTYAMLKRLQTIASFQTLPMALYGFSPSGDDLQDAGVRMILHQPGPVDIKTLLTECLEAKWT